MKIAALVFLCIAFVSCDNCVIVTSSEPMISDESIGSFRNRRGEIGQEILEEMTRQGVEHWINDDGTIVYFLADGDKIDAIAYYARGKYAARN